MHLVSIQGVVLIGMPGMPRGTNKIRGMQCI